MHRTRPAGSEFADRDRGRFAGAKADRAQVRQRRRRVRRRRVERPRPLQVQQQLRLRIVQAERTAHPDRGCGRSVPGPRPAGAAGPSGLPRTPHAGTRPATSPPAPAGTPPPPAAWRPAPWRRRCASPSPRPRPAPRREDSARRPVATGGTRPIRPAPSSRSGRTSEAPTPQSPPPATAPTASAAAPISAPPPDAPTAAAAAPTPGSAGRAGREAAAPPRCASAHAGQASRWRPTAVRVGASASPAAYRSIQPSTWSQVHSLTAAPPPGPARPAAVCRSATAGS